MKYCRKPNNGHRLRRAIIRKGDIADATMQSQEEEILQLTENPVAEPPSNAGARGKPLTSHDPNRAFNCLPPHNCSGVD